MAAALPREDENIGRLCQTRKLRGRDEIRVHNDLASREQFLECGLGAAPGRSASV